MRTGLRIRCCLALLAAAALCAAVQPSRAYAAHDPPIEELAELSPAAAQLVADSGQPIGVAVYDLQRDVLWSVNGRELFYTYSTIKVPILLGVLERAQREQRPLSAREDALLREMVDYSDNWAAEELLDGLGAGALQRSMRAWGLAASTVRGDLWGGSLTTAQEQARLMAMLADCSLLDAERCTYAQRLLRSVTPSQAWGITAGAPAGAAIALKNGWFPEAEGWGINTIGFVDAGRRYTIAVYSRRNESKASGIRTVERIVAELHAALAALPPVVPAAAEHARPLLRHRAQQHIAD